MTEAIIFGTGFLGTRMAQQLGYPAIPKNVCDLTNPIQIESVLNSYAPRVVINCTGKTGGPGEIGIDWCELNHGETIRSNVVGPVNLSVACARKGIYFVHLGSGCVYHGDNSGKGFSEEDSPNFYGPQFYAMTKIDSERILKTLPGLLLRIRMPIDDRPHPRNLIDKLASYPQVIDIQNSMTTIPDMIWAIRKLIELGAQGVYNLANPGSISAVEIMSLYRRIVDPEHSFKTMTLEELDAKTRGKRSNCILDTRKLKEIGIEMPEIHGAVESCLKKYSEIRSS